MTTTTLDAAAAAEAPAMAVSSWKQPRMATMTMTTLDTAAAEAPAVSFSEQPRRRWQCWMLLLQLRRLRQWQFLLENNQE